MNEHIQIEQDGAAEKASHHSFPSRRSAFCVVLAVVVGFFLSATAIAQNSSSSIKATLNRDHVLIGEQIELHIEVNADATSPLTQWINLPDSFNHLEVLSRSQIDTVRKTAGISYRQHLIISGFEPGIWNIPALQVMLHNKIIQADSLSVTIVPVTLKDSTYHDIRTIIDVPEEKAPWWYWLAGSLSVLALAILVGLWLKTRTARISVTQTDGSTTEPYQEAMSRLWQLANDGLAERREWKLYYSQLTGIFKRYIERKCMIPVMQYTTDELLLHLKTRLAHETSVEIAETLRIADAVKFAMYQPADEQAGVSIRSIERTIQLMDQKKS